MFHSPVKTPTIHKGHRAGRAQTAGMLFGSFLGYTDAPKGEVVTLEKDGPYHQGASGVINVQCQDGRWARVFVSSQEDFYGPMTYSVELATHDEVKARSFGKSAMTAFFEKRRAAQDVERSTHAERSTWLSFD